MYYNILFFKSFFTKIIRALRKAGSSELKKLKKENSTYKDSIENHIFINDSEDPSEKIIQLLTDSLSPVISKVRLDFDKDVVESIIPNPESLPYILKNYRLS